MYRFEWTRVRGLGAALPVATLIALTGCGGGEPAEEAPMVEEAPAMEAAEPTMPEAMVLDATELQQNAAAHEGQTVRLDNIPVQSPVGTSAVWIELPNKNPFLVHTSTPPAASSHVDIVGEIKPMTDALADEWVSAGEITENDKVVITFATHYLDATAIQPTAGM